MKTGAEKTSSDGTERAVPIDDTLDRIQPKLSQMGITRVATLTGLDRIGVPVVAVYRPESRSLAVAQGKGLTLAAARASGLMESIELYHAEHVELPLLYGSYRELASKHRMVEVPRLPRLSSSTFHQDLPLLWVSATDLLGSSTALLPYELVHMDLRTPLPAGSGAFFMSSNGLASGNTLEEAVAHAIWELIERDANTLWHVGGGNERASTRVDLETVNDPDCLAVLSLYDQADVEVCVHETTTDLGIPSFNATVIDRDEHQLRLMPPLCGSGCHPQKRIALLRALTEAAQGRLTMISGARDDWSPRAFEPHATRERWLAERERFARVASGRSYRDVLEFRRETFAEDIQVALMAVARAGLGGVWVINLTRPQLGIPVVRVVIPGLESLVEVPGMVLGERALRANRANAS